MLSQIKSKLWFKRRTARLLTAQYQPVEDPLGPIATDLAAILRDVKAIAIDKPAAKARDGGLSG